MVGNTPQVPSRLTWVVFGVTVGIVAASALLVAFGVGGEFGTIAAADIGEMLAVGISAVGIMWAANRLGPSSKVGRNWLLIGAGAFSYAIGDTLWTILEVGLRQPVPYPGTPDVFYLIEYPLVAAGLIFAAMAFRGLVPLRRPVIFAVATGAVLSAVIYFALLQPTVLFAPDISLAEKTFSTLYPLGDVWLMVVPAMLMIAVVRKLGGGRLAWPWWAVAAGTVVIALSDVTYSWLSANNLYASGSIVDYGWGVGHALIMLGALITLDLARRSA